jgi:hypothetical protein
MHLCFNEVKAFPKKEALSHGREWEGKNEEALSVFVD